MTTHASSRRWSLLVALATLIASGVMMLAAPAHAAGDADLTVKGTGTVYTQSPVITRSVVPGGTSPTWTVKITNNTFARQLKVAVASVGTSDVHYSFKVNNDYYPTYYTPPIQPGASVTVVLVAMVSATAPPGTFAETIRLTDPATGAILDTFQARTVVTNQTGTTKHDLFLKSGSQPYVGGSVPQAISSNALKVGNSATFLMRMQNNGTTAARITLAGPTSPACEEAFTWTVKQGLSNVTAAVDIGFIGWDVGPGAKVDFKLTVKYAAPSSCTASSFTFSANGPDGWVSQTAHVLLAA